MVIRNCLHTCACVVYILAVATIQGWGLFKEMWYVSNLIGQHSQLEPDDVMFLSLSPSLPPPLDWGLPKSDIELSQLLGRGEFGEVHSGIYRGTQVAVKSIHESKQSDAAVANFLREASFMTLVCVCV